MIPIPLNLFSEEFPGCPGSPPHFTGQFEDGVAGVPGNALVGLRILKPGAEEGMVETLAAGGEAVDRDHDLFAPFKAPFLLADPTVVFVGSMSGSP